jgi:hypothetical protein
MGSATTRPAIWTGTCPRGGLVPFRREHLGDDHRVALGGTVEDLVPLDGPGWSPLPRAHPLVPKMRSSLHPSGEPVGKPRGHERFLRIAEHALETEAHNAPERRSLQFRSGPRFFRAPSRRGPRLHRNFRPRRERDSRGDTQALGLLALRTTGLLRHSRRSLFLRPLYRLLKTLQDSEM